jgi:AraC family transcriptional regulator, exoenzyme S synthesis regulatory protein ExsA
MDSFFDFINEHPPVKRLQVNDILLAEYQCPLSEFRYDIWSHHNYFIYVMSGQKKWFTKNQDILVKQGDCLFVRKGAHSVYQFFDSEFCALVMFVPDEFIRSVLLDNRIRTGNHQRFIDRDSLFSIHTDEQLAAYFRSFYTYIKAPEKPANSLIELKFKELIILTGSSAGPQNLADYFACLCNSGEPSLRSLMEENFNYPMNLEEYARLSNRSLSTFKRDFKDEFGTTPARWLMQKRLDLSKYLLENTNKTVTEIALDAGFKNHSHFSRVFKDKFGITPLHLAKNQTQQL